MAEIEKIAVYDARIIQDPPKYAVQKGSLSVSTSTFQANAANASQLSFQVLVPSLNVFTDRKIELQASTFVYAEAVPSQFVQTITARPSAVPPLVAGNYINGTSERFCYDAQDYPLLSGYSPNGNFISGGNTAAIVPDNAWVGLQTQGVGDVIETGSSITPFTIQGSPNPLTLTLNSATAPTPVLFGNNIANPFAQFAVNGGTVTGTFTIDFDLRGGMTGVTTNINGAVLQIDVVDPTNPTFLYASTKATIVVTNDNPVDATPFASCVGSNPIVLNSSSICVPPLLTFQVRAYSGIILTPNVTWSPLSYAGMSGFELDALWVPPRINLYQSIGAPSDLSLSMFPIQTLATSMTVTINDCSVSVTGDVLREQLLLSQTRDSLMQRTCASKFDIYAWTRDDARAENGVTNGYNGARDSDIPNGSYPLTFVHPQTGAALNQYDAYQYTLPSGQVVVVPIINWRPAFIPISSNLVGQYIPSSSMAGGQYLIAPTLADVVVPVMFKFTSTEPLCISPFLWQDSKQMTEVGLYGITNMTVNMTLGNPGPVQGYNQGTLAPRTVGRLYYDKLNNAAGSYQYMTRQSGINALFGNMRLQPPTTNLGNQTGPWVEPPKLLCTFLTPPPEITLPLVSSVPYVEFPRYNSSASVTLSTAGKVVVSSNTVTLSSIPDLLVVFVKPAFRGQTQADTYIPISNIGVTFDNYANLCSNYSQEDLYACSVAGGLDMDFNQFRGFARSKISTLTPYVSGTDGTNFDTLRGYSAFTQLTGSPVVLRMGQDIPLSSGLAPGTLGNYSVQVSVTLDNTNGFFNYLSQMGSTSNNVIITIMGVNSGFFESVRGSSALRKTILNTNDVEAASTSASITSSQLVRLVGGAQGMHTSSRLTTSLGMPQFKPAMGEEQRVRKMARHSSGSMIS